MTARGGAAVRSGQVRVTLPRCHGTLTPRSVLTVIDEVDGYDRARSVRLCGDWVKIPRVLLLGDGGSDDDLPWTGDQRPGKSSLRHAKVGNPRGVRNHGAKSQSASIGRALIPPP